MGQFRSSIRQTLGLRPILPSGRLRRCADGSRGSAPTELPSRSASGPAKKLTTISATVSDLQSFFVPCSHQVHEASLCGRDGRNRFRTRLAQAYPSKFCEKLASLHILTMMERGATDEIELNERAVRELVNEVRDRRRRQVRELEVLPRDFALADG